MATFYLLWLLQSWINPASPPADLQHRPEASMALDSNIVPVFQQRLQSYLAEARPEKCYVHTDRPMVSPGDTLWFCAYLLDAGNLRMSGASDVVHVELLDPAGKTAARKTILALDGTAPGAFPFPANCPGGAYKIKAYSNWMRNADSVFYKNIVVQEATLPAMNLYLDFKRQGFGPGDEVWALFEGYDLENKPLARQKIRYALAIDGRQVFVEQTRANAAGKADIRFRLPERLRSTDGVLTVEVTREGQTEAISRPIPIVLKNISLRFFPEGGDAVAGLPCRMAFKSLDAWGKSADVSGVILNARGDTMTPFQSFHRGMGAFDYTPARGEVYYAKVCQPFDTIFTLPTALESGECLRLAARSEGALSFEVRRKNSQNAAFLVGVFRDSVFFSEKIQPGSDLNILRVPISETRPGIARFTLFNERYEAMAERLVFINRDQGLQVNIQFDKEAYGPREPVNMQIQVKDAAGRPASGAFSLAVTDETLLSLADDRQGHIAASLLLEQDIKGEIEEPNFYFDPKEADAEQALDYLLTTQGWRRFVWKAVFSEKKSSRPYIAQRAELSGIVFDLVGKNKRGDTVTLQPNGRIALTDAAGRFIFKKVDLTGAGPYYLTACKQEKPVQKYTDNFFLGHYRLYQQTPEGVVSVRLTPGGGKRQIIKGVIKDAATLEPVVGVTCRLKDTHYGASTDIDGRFQIEFYPYLDVLSFEATHTGYNNVSVQNMQIDSGFVCIMDIAMQEANILLDEAQVTAYAVQYAKQDISYSVSKIDVSDVKKRKNFAKKRSPKATPATVALNSPLLSATAPAIKQEKRAPKVAPPQVRPRFRIAHFFSRRKRSVQKTQPTPKRATSVQEWTNILLLTLNDVPPLHHFERARAFYVPDYTRTDRQTAAPRSDFRSVIYWNPRIRLDATGLAKVSFFTSDALSGFRATLEGLDQTGVPTHAEQKMYTQKPVAIALKSPPRLVEGDTIQWVIAASNRNPYPVSGRLFVDAPQHFIPLDTTEAPVDSLYPGETRLISRAFAVSARPNADDKQTVNFRFQNDADTLNGLALQIPVLQRGFPVKEMFSANAPKADFKCVFHHLMPGSLSVQINAYPDVIHEATKSADRMLRQPTGCFEQVSSSNYPNVLVLDLLRSRKKASPEIERRAKDLLKDGYRQLIQYECKNGGFGYWGGEQGNLFLTAYGIMEFTDMGAFMQVDQEMIKRSVEWLLNKSRSQAKSGYSDDIQAAYIAWAAASAGYGALFKTEIDTAFETARRSNDPYQAALVANALIAMNDARYAILLDFLSEKQQENGAWMGASKSVVGSMNQHLAIETTSLALLAFTQTSSPTGRMKKGFDFLLKTKTSYGYGNTQGTILTLKALVAYAKQMVIAGTKNTLIVKINDKTVAEQPFLSDQSAPVAISGLERYLDEKGGRISVAFKNTAYYVPIDIDIQYQSKQPQDARESALSFSTRLSQEKAEVGESVRLETTLSNTSNQTLASPMIMLGIPAGLNLQPWQLKQLSERHAFDYYEIWGPYLVFHFRQLAPGETKNISLDLRADIAGRFESPAAQAFLYYANDRRVWSSPLQIRVLP